MTEPDNSPQTSSPNYNQSIRGFRGGHSNRAFRVRTRGFGRTDPSVAKALCYFGVPDLGDLLNQKQEQNKNSPPDDPSYRFLKDPSREDDGQGQNKQIRPARSRSGEPAPRNSKQKVSSRSSERVPLSSKPQFIKNPSNITVELTRSTGSRNCKIDKDKKIGDIRHMPDDKFADLISGRFNNTSSHNEIKSGTSAPETVSSSNGGTKNLQGKETRGYEQEFNRGRSRGRGGEFRARGGEYRARGGEYRGRGGEYRGRGGEYRGRGGDFRGRGGEFRGRGGEFRGSGGYDFRGRGRESRRGEWYGDFRGRGYAGVPNENRLEGSNSRRSRSSRRASGSFRERGSRRSSNVTEQSHTSVVGNDVEENWDDEIHQNDLDSADAGSNQIRQLEENVADEQYSEAVGYDQHSEIDEDLQNLQLVDDTLDENLVVTTSVEGENKKRIVRFNLENEQEPQPT